jgi:hypothetical protein
MCDSLRATGIEVWLHQRHQEADQSLRAVPAHHLREHERPLGGLLSARVEEPKKGGGERLAHRRRDVPALIGRSTGS